MNIQIVSFAVTSGMLSFTRYLLRGINRRIFSGDRMNIILLSGGSGKRLWPLSNDIQSKQFLRLFKTDDGRYESMLQRVYRQIKSVSDAQITIATSQPQVSAIRNQLGNKVSVCIEPCRRDTFPAIALAAEYR